MSASCSDAWHSGNKTFGILRNNLWNSSHCIVGRRSTWTGGPSVWNSWSECCADWDVASHPDKAGMHIICLPGSGVREEPPRTAWHAHPCALFRSKHEAAQCLRKASVTVCSCQLLELNGQGRWSWRWHCVYILRWRTGYWQSASSHAFVFRPATSVTADKRAYHGSENEG